MNKNIYLILLILLEHSLIAQDVIDKYGKNEEKCKRNRSLYMEDYKLKDFDSAYKNWKYCIDSCPKSTKNLYIHGPKLIKYKLKKAKTEEEKNRYKQLLISVYDKRLKYFPGREGYVLTHKGSEMLKMGIGTPLEAYEILKKAFELDKDKLSAPGMYSYFMSSVKLFTEKTFKIEQVFDIYNDVMESLDTKVNNFNIQISELELKNKLSPKEKKLLKSIKKKLKRTDVNIRKSINKVIAPIAKCDKLVPIYTKNFETNKTNIIWLKGAMRMLITKKCTEEDIYLQIAKATYKIDPKPAIARAIAAKEFKSKNFKEALEYYEKSIETEEDPHKKGSDKLMIARIKLAERKKNQARKYALEAIDLKPKWGEPHIFIGNLYANSANACGKNAFQKKAVYWLAIDEFKKAISDEKFTKKALKLIKSYAPLTPSKTLIFQFGYTKKKFYKIKCWINRTVAIPSK